MLNHINCENWLYRFSEYIHKCRILYIQNSDTLFNRFGRDQDMTYAIEIELPRSGIWFKYFTVVDSLEEAKSIKEAAEGSVKARIMKNS